MTEDKTYNGWSTYETWSVNLWLDDFFTEEAQDIWNNTENDEDFSREENSIFQLSESIKDFVDEQAPELEGLYGDLLTGVLQSEINYREIAASYINEVEKDDDE